MTLSHSLPHSLPGDYDKRTALHIAAAGGELGMVKLLVEEGKANIGCRDRWGLMQGHMWAIVGIECDQWVPLEGLHPSCLADYG